MAYCERHKDQRLSTPPPRRRPRYPRDDWYAEEEEDPEDAPDRDYYQARSEGDAGFRRRVAPPAARFRTRPRYSDERGDDWSTDNYDNDGEQVHPPRRRNGGDGTARPLKPILKPQCKSVPNNRDQSTGTDNCNQSNNNRNGNNRSYRDQYDRRNEDRYPRRVTYRDEEYRAPRPLRPPADHRYERRGLDHYDHDEGHQRGDGQHQGQGRDGYGYHRDNREYDHNEHAHEYAHKHTELEKKLANYTRREPERIKAARKRDRMFIGLLICMVVVMAFFLLVNDTPRHKSATEKPAKGGGDSTNVTPGSGATSIIMTGARFIGKLLFSGGGSGGGTHK